MRDSGNKKYTARSRRVLQLITLQIGLSALAGWSLMLAGFSWDQALAHSGITMIAALPFILVISVIQKYNHANIVFGVPNLVTTAIFAAAAFGLFHLIAPLTGIQGVQYESFLTNALIPQVAVTLLFFYLTTALFWIDRERIQVERIRKFAIEKERESIRIELNSIQQQFKPHFLFNSLNSISALSISNPTEARKMIQLLSDFMRKAVKENQSELIPLEDEIAHLRTYTEIEKIRFGERLIIDYQIEEDALQAKVPSLILQPVIENAIKYGLYGQIGEVTITISILMGEKGLEITLENPYDEESQQASSGTGYGLQSIEKKLLLIYKRAHLLSTQGENGIFKTNILIPQI
jgi:two-component system LytT family sensor kinase